MPTAEEDLLHEIRVQLKTFHWLSPINLVKEKEIFFNKRNYNPQLKYPTPPAKKFKRYLKLLDKINIDKDKNLESYIKRKKVKETKLKLLLILVQGTPYISEVSQKLYQLKLSKKYINQALIDSALEGNFTPQESLNADQTVRLIIKYLKKYNISDWAVRTCNRNDFNFQVRHKKKLISISEDINWDYISFDSTVAHEIDVHVIRALNARKQNNPILRENFPFYIKTEEGLASLLGDYYSNGSKLSRKHHAIKYLAGYFALNNSFRETYNLLVDYGFTKDLAFQRAIRIKRGFTDTSSPGLFARELMYYEGMLEVKKYLNDGGDIKKLFAGKVGLADLDFVSVPKNQVIPPRVEELIN